MITTERVRRASAVAEVEGTTLAEGHRSCGGRSAGVRFVVKKRHAHIPPTTITTSTQRSRHSTADTHNHIHSHSVLILESSSCSTEHTQVPR